MTGGYDAARLSGFEEQQWRKATARTSCFAVPAFCVVGRSSESQITSTPPTARQLVYRWEAGKRSPGPFYRERLCQVFDMTAEELGLVELRFPTRRTLRVQWPATGHAGPPTEQ